MESVTITLIVLLDDVAVVEKKISHSLLPPWNIMQKFAGLAKKGREKVLFDNFK